MTHEVRMPVLSQSMIQGRVVEWLVKEGEKVDKGTLLVVVESDKATHELESPQEGILYKILVEPESEVDVDTPLAIIASVGERTPEVEGPESSPEIHQETPVMGGLAKESERKPVSPAAKRLAKELGIDPTMVAGSGEGGLVTEKDIRTFAEEHAAAISIESEDAQVIPLTGQRGRIAERMALSRHTAADVTTVMDVDMAQVVEKRLQTGFSFTAYVVWAVAKALSKFPVLNAWVEADRILVKKSVHVGVAVATQGALVVPVLRNAQQKSLSELDGEINNLSNKARAGQLTPDDMKGSTFTVTNSGVYGSLFFTPIINLPEVAILGMGKVAESPVVRQGKVLASMVMYLCLSYDHRAVDGATAVQFLHEVKSCLEQPD
jgi:pyruvate/2-oxoglutarate dehydrogenase complex dihydrolipoamide acyltransferase (E2) component